MSLLKRVEKTQSTNPREIAIKILHDVEVNDTFTHQSILSFSKNLYLSSLDRRFLRELVHGTIKMRRRLDFVLGLFLEKKLEGLTPMIRNILRMGVYQIDFLTKVPESAAVDESVKLAKKFGHKGTVALVNAVLRSYLRDKSQVSFPSWEKDKVENISLFYSFPSWVVEGWLGIFGEEQTIKLCQAFNKRPRLCCRMNSLKIDHKGLEEIFKREKIKFKPSKFLKGFYSIESKVDLDRFVPLQKGLIYFQDESAGFPVMLLDPQPGDYIVDLCAAPGGKSTFIAERMSDQGLVLAVDISAKKLNMVRENCQRLGVRSVALCCADAKDFSCHPVDKILIDAPCSALGTLGRNPDARWRKQKEDPSRLQKLQLEILSNAAELLKDGGILVYSTCTITPEENEQVIEKFLEQRKDFRVAEGSHFVDFGVVDQNGMVRTLPHVHKMDGSFACRLEKV
ncbi:MAG: 16S rRNA (cytosine(967)-C(5))-methyltransferase RsmB [candidate division Zixibacteria bacterium]|nr:16S rRNA (cytosine(967)-C(5))-methyltransferase RsmB [candidate division Zixibacteria bacterium]